MAKEVQKEAAQIAAAEAPAEKKKEKKSQKEKPRSKKKHTHVQVWKLYEVKDGKVSRKRESCPRCGPGTFLASFKTRKYCGKCGYGIVGQELKGAPKEARSPEERKPAAKAAAVAKA